MNAPRALPHRVELAARLRELPAFRRCAQLAKAKGLHLDTRVSADTSERAFVQYELSNGEDTPNQFRQLSAVRCALLMARGAR